MKRQDVEAFDHWKKLRKSLSPVSDSLVLGKRVHHLIVDIFFVSVFLAVSREYNLEVVVGNVAVVVSLGVSPAGGPQ